MAAGFPSRAGAGPMALGAAALAAGIAVLVWSALASPYQGYDGESAEIVIPRGAGPARVASILHEAGVIRSPFLFRLQAKLTGGSHRLQAGEYRFEGRLSMGEVLERILDGEVILHKVTLPEGLTGREIIDRLAAEGLASRADLLKAFADPSAVRDLDPEAPNLEGYLFPDTYHFARPTPAAQIFRAMVERFREEFDGDLRKSAAEVGLSVRETVTLASLIEKETSLDEERGRVSAVFHNRLRRRMPLQCDPTVIYALSSDGLYRGSLSRDDLAYDSLYNTYVYAGLPPGPIAAPGREALVAAVHPDDVPYLYFVADGTGGHTFSRSLEEHLRAVETYRRMSRKGA